MQIHFVPSRINGHSYSEQFIKTIAQLPVAQEKFDYVNKRISSWEGYLKVLYKNANIDDIEANIQSISYSSDFSTVSLKVMVFTIKSGNVKRDERLRSWRKK